MSPRGGNCAEVNSAQSIVWRPSVTPALNEITAVQTFTGTTPQNLSRGLEGLPRRLFSTLPFHPFLAASRPVTHVGADSRDSTLMFLEDKSSGRLWSLMTAALCLHPDAGAIRDPESGAGVVRGEGGARRSHVQPLGRSPGQSACQSALGSVPRVALPGTQLKMDFIK